MSTAHQTPAQNLAAPLPVLYQREAQIDATFARAAFMAGDMIAAARRQRHAAHSSAKARQLMGVES